MSRSLVITKTGGLVSHEVPHQTLAMWLESISNGQWELTLTRYKNPRTLSQNALMWKWFEAIAYEWNDLTGESYTKEMIKEYFCQRFIPVHVQGRVIGGSTSGLNSEQMSKFMEQIQAYMLTEWGMKLPSSDDKYLDEWLREYKHK